MVARIDVRSLVKRAKEEQNSCSRPQDANKSYGALAAETVRQHAQQQTRLDLTKASVSTDIQVGALLCWGTHPLIERFQQACIGAETVLPARVCKSG